MEMRLRTGAGAQHTHSRASSARVRGQQADQRPTTQQGHRVDGRWADSLKPWSPAASWNGLVLPRRRSTDAQPTPTTTMGGSPLSHRVAEAAVRFGAHFCRATAAAALGSTLVFSPPIFGVAWGGETAKAEAEPLAEAFQTALRQLRHVGPRPRQSFFTVTGTPRGPGELQISADGAIGVRQKAPLVSAMLVPADGSSPEGDVATHRLLEGHLPIPQVVRNTDGPVRLEITAFTGDNEIPGVRYRIERTTPTVASDQASPSASAAEQRINEAAHEVRLRLAVLPFDVNPEWQYGRPGSRSPIHQIEVRENVVYVNEAPFALLSRTPERVATATQIAPAEGGRDTPATTGSSAQHWQMNATTAPRAADALGRAGVVLEYTLKPKLGEPVDLFLLAPEPQANETVVDGASYAATSVESAGRAQLDRAAQTWRNLLGSPGGPRIEGPEPAIQLFEKMQTHVAQILVNADGPELKPGSRAYAHTWMRDGAVMASALLEAGQFERAREFIEWYLKHEANGFVPSGYDALGPSSAVEQDSHGELLWIVGEYFRFTHDRAFLASVWPSVQRIVANIEELRGSPSTPAEQDAEQAADRCGDLMPKSISHEGYPRPVCAYWDNYWTLAGLKAAAEMAPYIADAGGGGGVGPDALRFATIRDEFAEALKHQIRSDIERFALPYVPASDRQDQDPSALPVGLVIADGQDLFPTNATKKTFERYLAHLEARISGEIKHTYAPYEIRIVEALIRMGQREDAHKLLSFLMRDQRPRGWSQYAEIVYPDPDQPAFFGDTPHTWIGSEAGRAIRSIFAYESNGQLVVGAGVPAEWLPSGDTNGIRIENLPTHFGTLSYTLKRAASDDARWTLAIDGLIAPPNGVVLKPPAGISVASTTVNGRVVPFDRTEEGVCIQASHLGALTDEAIRAMGEKFGGKRDDGDNEPYLRSQVRERAAARQKAEPIAEKTGLDPGVLTGDIIRFGELADASATQRFVEAVGRLRPFFDTDVLNQIVRELGAWTTPIEALAGTTESLRGLEEILGRATLNEAFRIKPHSAGQVAEWLKRTTTPEIAAYVKSVAGALGSVEAARDFYRNNPYAFFEILDAQRAMTPPEFEATLKALASALGGADGSVRGRAILLRGMKTTGAVGALLARRAEVEAVAARYGAPTLVDVFGIEPEFLVPVFNSIHARAQNKRGDAAQRIDQVLSDVESLLGRNNIPSFLENPGKAAFLGQIIDELDVLSKGLLPNLKPTPVHKPNKTRGTRGPLNPREKEEAMQDAMTAWLHMNMLEISEALNATHNPTP